MATPQRPRQVVKKKPSHLVIGVVILVAIFLIGAGITVYFIQSGKKTVSYGEQYEGPVYNIGQEAPVTGMTVIANSIVQGYVSSDPRDKPMYSSNQFVLVNVTVKNTGSERTPLFYMDFSVVDDTGYENTARMLWNLENNLCGEQQGFIAPGESRTGNIVFEAKKGSEHLWMYYERSFPRDKTAIYLK